MTWLFTFKTYDDFLFFFYLRNVWLSQNVQWSLRWLCVFGSPKQIKQFLNVLKILLMMNKFLKVGFGQYDLRGN
jgi:hypothetical protein